MPLQMFISGESMKNTHSPKALFLSGLLFLAITLATPTMVLALASNNVPLDSPIYSYLEKLASFGLLTSDFRGIRPMTKAEVARLLLEAERNRNESKDTAGHQTGDGQAPDSWKYQEDEMAALRGDIVD